MAAAKMKVQRSSSVNMATITVDDLVKAQTAVGAPGTATVATGSGYTVPSPDGQSGEYLPYSVTFTWTEEV